MAGGLDTLYGFCAVPECPTALECGGEDLDRWALMAGLTRGAGISVQGEIEIGSAPWAAPWRRAVNGSDRFRTIYTTLAM